MSRELTMAWELLEAVASVQQRLASVRPFIWERTRLATAEHTIIARATIERPVLHLVGGAPVTEGDTWRPNDEGDHVVVEVSVETRLPDGRSVGSYLEMIAGAERWRVHPYIGIDDGAMKLLWDGPAIERDDVASFLESVDTAVKNLVTATIRLDFDKIRAG